MAATRLNAWRFDTTDVVAVDGPLDLAASVQLRLVLYDLLDSADTATDVVVDLTDAPIVDASAVGVLLAVREQLLGRGGDLRVEGAGPLAREVMEVTGAAKALLAGRPAGRPDRDDADAAPEAPATHGRWGDKIDTLVVRLKGLAADDPERARARQRLIEACLPFAERLARRFHGLGEPVADLNQVAALGLVKAVDRFDPRVGTDLSRYAAATIIGELKRHFRDRGWSVRVPRRLKDLRLEINQAGSVLAQHLGHSPTAREVGDYLHVDEEQVAEAIVAANGYRAGSLYAPSRADAAVTAPVHWLGHEDEGIDAIDNHEVLKPLIAALPDREQRILLLRFYGNQTQAQIASQLGISQMHVSRLLTRVLRRLREQMLTDD